MAEHDENSLIGYDPLAWLNKEEFDNWQIAETQKTDTEWQPAISALDQNDAPDAKIEANAGLQYDAPDNQLAESNREFQQDIYINEVIVLDSILTIQNVAKLHERLLLALNGANKIEIDASAVKVADTATMQLLLILKRTAIKDEKKVIIDFPSEKFIEAAELLGIAEMLEVDHAAAGFF